MTIISTAINTTMSAFKIGVCSLGLLVILMPTTWGAVAISGPSSGTELGRTPVTITGDVDATTTVTFDGAAGTPLIQTVAGTIIVATPAHAAGAVAVAVTTGVVTTTLAGGFTYLASGATGLPDPWLDADVGNAALPGTAAWVGGRFTIKASGVDIWDNVDGMHYIYRVLRGDGEIIARVSNMEFSDNWAKAGVMVRASLNGDSAQGAILLAAGPGFQFVHRDATGVGSADNGTSASAPSGGPESGNWLRLTRVGNVVNGYWSLDGTTWTPSGNANATLGTDVVIGLALTSHNNGVYNTATIDQVSVVGLDALGAPVAAPAAPTGLTATVISPVAVTLAWADNATNETGYVVERRTGVATFAAVASLAADSSGFADTGLTPGTQYDYRVRAFNHLDSLAANVAATTSATTITTVSPTSAGVGQSVTITGTYLNQSPVVTIGGATATITSTAATQLIVTVPALATVGAAMLQVATTYGNASSAFTVFGVPAKLTFVVNPTNAGAGATIAPVIQVAVQDAAGNTITSDSTTSVAVSLTTAGGAVLSGTSPQVAASGVASFANLAVNQVGTSYTLTAVATGLTDAVSASFAISVGTTAARLVFTVEPSNAVAGATIAPVIQVAVQDASGNTVTTDSTTSVAVSLTTPGGAVLSGTSPQVAASGVASFANLAVNQVGTYTLTAMATGLTNAVSASFTISAGTAAMLTFVVEPTSAVAGATIAPTVTVAVQDAAGNTVTTATPMIVLALTTPGAATLGGTLSQPAVAGVASFANLSVNLAGTYTLTATSGVLTADTSAGFTITAAGGGSPGAGSGSGDSGGCGLGSAGALAGLALLFALRLSLLGRRPVRPEGR